MTKYYLQRKIKQSIVLGSDHMQIISFHMSLFGNYIHLGATPERITKLMGVLPGFIPSTLHTVNMDFSTGGLQKVQRMQMLDTANGWTVNILPDRLDVVFEASTNNDIGQPSNYEELKNIGLKYLQDSARALAIDKKIGRLALNSKVIFPTQTGKPKIKYLASLPPCFESAENVTEWNINLNSRGSVLIGSIEATNEIMTWGLYTSLNDPQQYGIILTTDINTMQTDLSERFAANEMEQFLTYAIKRTMDMIRCFE